MMTLRRPGALVALLLLVSPAHSSQPSAYTARQAGTKCDGARELVNTTRVGLTSSSSPQAFADAMQNLQRATQMCSGSGDAYYFLSLVAAEVKDSRAAAWHDKAVFFGSKAMDAGESLFLSGAPTAARQPPATVRPGPAKPPVVVEPYIQRKLALVVGVGRFKDGDINRLRYTSADAAAVAEALKTDCDFDKVTVLLDEEATVYNIRTEIEKLAREATTNDLVVVYLASHGSPENLDTAGVNYIVAYDTEIKNLYPTAYQMDEVLQAINERIKAERVVAFLDTCYSGGTFRVMPQGWKTSSRALVSDMGLVVSALQDKLAGGSRSLGVASSTANAIPTRQKSGFGRVMITSSTDSEKSWEDERIAHGYFTYFLLQALRRPGALSVQDIYALLRTKVPEAVLRDKGQPQHPSIAQIPGEPLIYLKDRIK